MCSIPPETGWLCANTGQPPGYASEVATAAIRPGSLFATLPTRRSTGTKDSVPACDGRRRDSSSSRPAPDGSIHRSSASDSKITGIRSWNGATSLFASVVMIVHDRIHFASPSLADGLRQNSHKTGECHGVVVGAHEIEGLAPAVLVLAPLIKTVGNHGKTTRLERGAK